MPVEGYDHRSVTDISKQLRAALKTRAAYRTNAEAAKKEADRCAADLAKIEDEVAELKEELFDCYEKGL